MSAWLFAHLLSLFSLFLFLLFFFSFSSLVFSLLKNFHLCLQHFQYLHQDTLHDERIIAVREEPSLHVKRSGEWLNMESRNLVPGRAPHIEIRDVVGTFFVSFNGVVQCTIDYTGHGGTLHQMCSLCLCNCRLQQSAHRVDQLTCRRTRVGSRQWASDFWWDGAMSTWKVSITSDTEQYIWYAHFAPARARWVILLNAIFTFGFFFLFFSLFFFSFFFFLVFSSGSAVQQEGNVTNSQLETDTSRSTYTRRWCTTSNSTTTDLTSRSGQTFSPIQRYRKAQETAKCRDKDEANEQWCSSSRFTIPAHQKLNARARERRNLQRRNQSCNTTKFSRGERVAQSIQKKAPAAR